MLEENGNRLRVYVGERKKHQGIPLYEWIVRKAQEQKLAGATVVRAVEGFGAHHEIHTAKLMDLSTNLPMIVEIVDEASRIENFLTLIEPAIDEGLVTVESLHIRTYRKAN